MGDARRQIGVLELIFFRWCKQYGGMNRDQLREREWAGVVVVDPPYLDDPACRSQASEQVLVQAFVLEAPVEALHKPVLLKLARRDVVPQHAWLLLPAQDRVRRELSGIHPARAVGGGQAAEMACFPGSSSMRGRPSGVKCGCARCDGGSKAVMRSACVCGCMAAGPDGFRERHPIVSVR